MLRLVRQRLSPANTKTLMIARDLQFGAAVVGWRGGLVDCQSFENCSRFFCEDELLGISTGYVFFGRRRIIIKQGAILKTVSHHRVFWFVCWPVSTICMLLGMPQITPETLVFDLFPNSQPGCPLYINNSSEVTIAFKVRTCSSLTMHFHLFWLMHDLLQL